MTKFVFTFSDPIFAPGTTSIGARNAFKQLFKILEIRFVNGNIFAAIIAVTRAVLCVNTFVIRLATLILTILCER